MTDSISHRLATEVCGWKIGKQKFRHHDNISGVVYVPAWYDGDTLVVSYQDLDFTKWPHAGLLLEGMARQGDKVWERFVDKLADPLIPYKKIRTQTDLVGAALRTLTPARIRAAAVETLKTSATKQARKKLWKEIQEKKPVYENCYMSEDSETRDPRC